MILILGKEVPKLQSLSAKMDAEKNKNCFNFTVGNTGMFEFFSPNYQNNYPNDTECERVIKGNFTQYSIINIQFDLNLY